MLARPKAAHPATANISDHCTRRCLFQAISLITTTCRTTTATNPCPEALLLAPQVQVSDMPEIQEVVLAVRPRRSLRRLGEIAQAAQPTPPTERTPNHPPFEITSRSLGVASSPRQPTPWTASSEQTTPLNQPWLSNLQQLPECATRSPSARPPSRRPPKLAVNRRSLAGPGLKPGHSNEVENLPMALAENGHLDRSGLFSWSRFESWYPSKRLTSSGVSTRSRFRCFRIR